MAGRNMCLRLTQGDFGAQGLAHDAHGTIDDSEATLLHGTCVVVGDVDVDGLVQGDFGAQELTRSLWACT